MKILFLSRWFPIPTDNGSKLRIFNILKELHKHHEVILLAFYESDYAVQSDNGLEALCSEHHVVSWKPFEPSSWRAIIGFVSRTPRSVVDTRSSAMAKKIRRILENTPIDVVIASQWPMAAYVESFKGYPALYEEIELGVLHDLGASSNNPWKRLRYRLTWIKQKKYLRHILKSFQAATVVSYQERNLLKQAAPGFHAVEVIPNCIDLSSYDKVGKNPGENSIIFTGSLNYAPNYYGVVWFLENVFPLVIQRLPHVNLTITGDHGNLALPSSDHVTLTGFVEDIRPLLARATLSIVPGHLGGGTRLKILEAMALRTPVVSTTKGAEGLNVRNGEHLIVADVSKQFADAVVKLMTNKVLREDLTENAYALVTKSYNWDKVFPRFLALVESLQEKPFDSRL